MRTCAVTFVIINANPLKKCRCLLLPSKKQASSSGNLQETAAAAAILTVDGSCKNTYFQTRNGLSRRVLLQVANHRHRRHRSETAVVVVVVVVDPDEIWSFTRLHRPKHVPPKRPTRKESAAAMRNSRSRPPPPGATSESAAAGRVERASCGESHSRDIITKSSFCDGEEMERRGNRATARMRCPPLQHLLGTISRKNRGFWKSLLKDDEASTAKVDTLNAKPATPASNTESKHTTSAPFTPILLAYSS